MELNQRSSPCHSDDLTTNLKTRQILMNYTTILNFVQPTFSFSYKDYPIRIRKGNFLFCKGSLPLLEFYSGSYRHPFDPLSRPFDNLFCVPYRGPRFQSAHKQKPLRPFSFPGV